MALNTFTPPKVQFLDENGAPLANGKVYTYEPGLSTPKATYSDLAGTTPNTNPVILNYRGEASIYLSGAYKIVIQKSDGTPVYTVDNFTGTTGFPINDDVAIFNDPSDSTKQVRLDAGSITTGTTRILSMPDKNVTPADINSDNSWVSQSLPDTTTFGDSVDPTKKVKLSAANVTTATTRTITIPDSDVTVSEYGSTLVDDSDAATARTTLGLGSAAIQNTGTSGANVPLLNASNTWSQIQTFSSSPVIPNASISTAPVAYGQILGQTWQDVKASRSLSSNYTNSTGRDIDISVCVGMGSGSGDVTLTVDSIIIASQFALSGSSNALIYGRISNGSTYSIAASAGTPNIVVWAEKR